MWGIPTFRMGTSRVQTTPVEPPRVMCSPGGGDLDGVRVPGGIRCFESSCVPGVFLSSDVCLRCAWWGRDREGVTPSTPSFSQSHQPRAQQSHRPDIYAQRRFLCKSKLRVTLRKTPLCPARHVLLLPAYFSGATIVASVKKTRYGRRRRLD
jgi:hypothetical protein